MIAKSLFAAKLLVRSVAASPFVTGLMAPMSDRLSVLNYHRVDTIGGDKKASCETNRSLTVSGELFTRHLRFLRRRMKCVSLAEAVDAIESKRDLSRMVVLTFDDGYRDNISVALEIAKKFDVPISIFVTTGFIDRTAHLWWEEVPFILKQLRSVTFDDRNGSGVTLSLRTEEKRIKATVTLAHLFKCSNLETQRRILDQLRDQAPERFSYDSEMLTWDDLRAAKRESLVTIGGHTCNHPVLTQESAVVVEREFLESQARFKTELGEVCQFLAYPNGQREHAAEREFDLARKVGYRAAFTSEPVQVRNEKEHSLFALPRLPVDESDSVSAFAWRLSGF